MSELSLQNCLGFKQIMRAGAGIIRNFDPLSALGDVATELVRQVNSVIHCVALSSDTIDDEPAYEVSQLDNGNYAIRKLRPDFFGILYNEEFDEENPPYTVLPGEYPTEAKAQEIVETIPLVYIGTTYYTSTQTQSTAPLAPQPPLSLEMATDILLDVNHIINLSSSAQHLADLISVQPGMHHLFNVLDSYIDRTKPASDNIIELLKDFFTGELFQRRTIHGLFYEERLADGTVRSILEMDGTMSNSRYRYAMTLIHELEHAQQAQNLGFTHYEAYRGLPLQIYNLLNFERELQAFLMKTKAALEIQEVDNKLRGATERLFLSNLVEQHLAIALTATDSTTRKSRMQQARAALLQSYHKETQAASSTLSLAQIQQWDNRLADPTKSTLDSKANLLTTLADWNNAGAGL